jgi:hypothetical protein
VLHCWTEVHFKQPHLEVAINNDIISVEAYRFISPFDVAPCTKSTDPNDIFELWQKLLLPNIVLTVVLSKVGFEIV